jgi:hypothetical protein
MCSTLAINFPFITSKLEGRASFEVDAGLAAIKAIGIGRAVQAARRAATINTIEVEDLPLAWISGNSLRTRVRVVGEIARQP